MTTKTTTTKNGTGFACVPCGATFTGRATCPKCGSHAIEFAPAPPVAPAAFEVGVATTRACGFVF